MLEERNPNIKWKHFFKGFYPYLIKNIAKILVVFYVLAELEEFY